MVTKRCQTCTDGYWCTCENPQQWTKDPNVPRTAARDTLNMFEYSENETSETGARLKVYQGMTLEDLRVQVLLGLGSNGKGEGRDWPNGPTDLLCFRMFQGISGTWGVNTNNFRIFGGWTKMIRDDCWWTKVGGVNLDTGLLKLWAQFLRRIFLVVSWGKWVLGARSRFRYAHMQGRIQLHIEFNWDAVALGLKAMAGFALWNLSVPGAAVLV